MILTFVGPDLEVGQVVRRVPKGTVLEGMTEGELERMLRGS